MESITMNLPSVLSWRQPSLFERRFHLHAGDKLFAELVFAPSHNAVATLMSADAASVTWTFCKMGMFLSKVNIREKGLDHDRAIYKPKFSGGGRLQFLPGESFSWQKSGYFSTEWSFISKEREKVVVCRYPFAELGKMQGEVQIEETWRGAEEVVVLVLLGWYLLVLDRHAGV